MMRTIEKVYIKVFGPNREELMEPLTKIGNLFTPKLVQLTASQFRFLDKCDWGN